MLAVGKKIQLIPKTKFAKDPGIAMQGQKLGKLSLRRSGYYNFPGTVVDEP